MVDLGGLGAPEPTTQPDPFQSRINAVGTLLIALTLLVGSGVMVVITQNNPAIFTAIIALVGPLCGQVVAHFYGMRAMAQGASSVSSEIKSTLLALQKQS